MKHTSFVKYTIPWSIYCQSRLYLRGRICVKKPCRLKSRSDIYTSIHVSAGPQLILLSAMAERREMYAVIIWESVCGEKKNRHREGIINKETSFNTFIVVPLRYNHNPLIQHNNSILKPSEWPCCLPSI